MYTNIHIHTNTPQKSKESPQNRCFFADIFEIHSKIWKNHSLTQKLQYKDANTSAEAVQ